MESMTRGGRAWLAGARRTGTSLRVVGWLPHVAVGLIALPFIVSQNSWYEWANTLWLLQLQTAHVAAYGIPSFFIDAPGQYFYPENVFYAGPILSILSYPSLLFGAWPVFAAVTAAAFSSSSAAISWTARNLGVPPRLAILPGLLFASTPYLVSNLYGRGAWSELVAVSALTVALGAATSLTAGRARSQPRAVAVLALAVAVVAGTHNLTLLLAALITVPLALALLPLLHGSRRALIHRHALVLGGAILGVALCGAFLAPNLWLSGRTVVQTTSRYFLVADWQAETFGALFNPANTISVAGTDFHSETLVAASVWIVVVVAVLAWRRRIDAPTARSLAVLGLLGAAIIVLIVDPAWWESFPAVLSSIQFTFRLVSYVALVTVLGVSVALSAPAVRHSRGAVVALILATGWQLGLAVDLAVTAQARAAMGEPAPSAASINVATNPPAFQPTFLQASEFRLIANPALAVPAAQASVEPIGTDTPSEVVLFGSQPPGTLVATTVVASPLIRVSGQAEAIGATASGFVVLRVKQSVHGAWRAMVTPVCGSCVKAIVGKAPLALFLGRLASLLAALTLLVLLAFPWLPGSWTSFIRGRGRGRGRSRAPSTPTRPPPPG